MNIDRKLNLVVPIYGAPKTVKDPATGEEKVVDNVVAYVHAAPISPEVFDKYFMTIGKTFAAIYGGGLGLFAGPRLAGKLLKKIAVEAGEWEGEGGVERGLIAEIRRLANVIVPGPKGWETVPFDGAAARGQISAEDAAEVENSLAFFTVACSMHRRNEVEGVLAIVSEIWGAQTSSLNCTAFAASLTT